MAHRVPPPTRPLSLLNETREGRMFESQLYSPDPSSSLSHQHSWGLGPYNPFCYCTTDQAHLGTGTKQKVVLWRSHVHRWPLIPPTQINSLFPTQPSEHPSSNPVQWQGGKPALALRPRGPVYSLLKHRGPLINVRCKLGCKTIGSISELLSMSCL